MKGGPRLRPAAAALGLLTVVPSAGAPSPDALWWFPAVGAGVGAAVGLAWWLAAHVWTAGVAAVLAVVADLALTGMLHADGLCDAADGLLAHMDRQRRLDVMATPDVGAFGVVVAVAVFLVRWTAMAALHPSIVLIVAIWTASRTWMAAALLAVPYARGPGGLAAAFIGPDSRRQFVALSVAGAVASFALAVTWRSTGGPVAVAAGTAAAIGVLALAHRRIGGFTGDVLGAAALLGETAALLVAAARW